MNNIATTLEFWLKPSKPFRVSISLVPYSPFIAWFSNHQYALDVNNPDENDFRRQLPRYQGDNRKITKGLAQAFSEFAQSKNATAAQLVLLDLAQGDDIPPGNAQNRAI